MAVVDARHEVRDVPLLVTVEVVRDEESQVVVLHIADDFGQIVFQCLSELLLPRIGVADDVRNVALPGISGVDGPRHVEVDPAGRAERVIRL